MKYIIGFIAGIAFIFGLAWILPDTEEKIYDCRVAEWHPDVPPAVKEECRKRRQEYMKGSKITT
jgi:hypothetical protein